MNPDECTICCNPFDKKKHKRHQCSNCNHQACFSCHETFLLGSSNDARCMNCNMAWSTVFLFRNFPGSFVTAYRKSRRESIWNRELFHLPTVMEYTDEENHYREAKKDENDLQQRLATLKSSFQELKGRRDNEAVRTRASIRLEKSNVYNSYVLKCKEARIRNYNLYQIRNGFIHPNTARGRQQRVNPETNSSYRNRPCIKEDCRGFVNSEGKCPICSTFVCIECNVEITENEEHACKQCDIDNWKEIRTNSRPCPVCHVYIFKISGCNQMYCTNCSTPFNWVTGMIETGPVHNPHYYEELFANPDRIAQRYHHRGGMNPNEDCENRGLIHIYDLRDRLRNRNDLTDDQKSNIFTRHRQLTHIQSVTLPKILSINNARYREYIFEALREHIKGGNVSVKVERFLNRKILNNEYGTLIETYINQQKQLFVAICNRAISMNEFEAQYDGFKDIMQDTVKDYNKMFKKSLKIDL